jgi:cyclophilin family peptidyl-prolyl cis-trans isomerase
MPSRARDRQLAKLAERRRAERTAAVRRRNVIIGLVIGFIVIALASVGVAQVFGGNGSTASGTPTATSSPSTSASPVVNAGKQTGTVKTAPAPATVACDGTAPSTATRPKPQFSGPVPMTIDTTKTYVAAMKTSCGTIVIRLAAKDAPIGVNNFVFLAKHHLYDGTWFHRIAPGFVIQGGDPKGDGSGGPGYSFTIESNPSTTFASASGLLALANSSKADTNGSQFFITLAKLPNLDQQQVPYTILGQVTQGMDVVKEIASVPTKANPGIPGEKSVPLRAVYVDSVRITEK